MMPIFIAAAYITQISGILDAFFTLRTKKLKSNIQCTRLWIYCREEDAKSGSKKKVNYSVLAYRCKEERENKKIT